MSHKMFDVPEVNVIQGARCTYCGAWLGEDCNQRDLLQGKAHVQRWIDYWNITHDRSQWREVSPARWLQRS